MYDFFFFFQAEDGIRDLVRSRGLGDVYKRQVLDMLRYHKFTIGYAWATDYGRSDNKGEFPCLITVSYTHLTLPTSDLV
mgnify:CR=1 FL=1